jgi:hypothetical protein
MLMLRLKELAGFAVSLADKVRDDFHCFFVGDIPRRAAPALLGADTGSLDRDRFRVGVSALRDAIERDRVL